jgi:hypothetical protein
MPFDGSSLNTCIIKPETVLLLRARGLIQNKKAWGVGCLEDINPLWKFWRSPVAYCAKGALLQASSQYDLGEEAFSNASKLLRQVAVNHGYAGLATLNDHPDTTHAFVMQVFDEAIELSKIVNE